MTELLTAAQMRAIEQAAIASGAVTGLELMERAGRGVVAAIFEEWPELRATSHRAVVLCGPGNNGGDGFVVARLLKEWGWEVQVFLYGDPERLPPDARVNYERWVRTGEVTVPKIDPQPLKDDSLRFQTNPDLIIDALFGTGLTRPFSGAFSMLSKVEVQRKLGSAGVRRVAVDIPTGLCADSGRILGEAVLPADLTVTFHGVKLGHELDDGPNRCGRLVIKDIGLALPAPKGDEARARPAGGAFAPAPGGRVGREPGFSPRQEIVHLTDATRARLAAAKANAHKYAHGHALILSGPAGRGGAARLAARGALRVGAGLVTVGCPLEAVPENAARLDAVMLRPIADAGVLARVLEDGRINALCLGPGMGTGEGQAELLAVALGQPPCGPPPPSPPHKGEGSRKGRPSREGGDVEALPLPLVGRGEERGAARKVVLDADALTILSHHPDLFAALHDGCVLTPHAGEFARLFPDIAEKLAAPATRGPAYSKVDATREAAARAGCVVLYKGPDTVIADPQGRCAINSAHYDRAAPWLATAGSGDVLAGFITGLLARGFCPFDAACTGAWLHVECARSFGPGLIAEDLPEELPGVFRALGL